MPAGIHYVDHWVSTPAVDLMNPDGTFIRAFAEADDVRIFNIDGKKRSYPGFVGADRTNQRAGGGGGEWFGYAIRWITSSRCCPTVPPPPRSARCTPSRRMGRFMRVC